jgi:multicomponent Na+:H+ antiporter subunit D
MLNVAAVGTALVYAKFLVLPHRRDATSTAKLGLWTALALLLGSLLLANVVYLEAYTGPKVLKALAVIGGGLLFHRLVVQRFRFTLPQVLEDFEHLIGGMSVMVVVLFLMVGSWLAI